MNFMLGFENYQLSAWLEGILVIKAPSRTDRDTKHVKKRGLLPSKKALKAIGIGIGLSTVVATSTVDQSNIFTQSSIIENVQKSDLSIQSQLQYSFESLQKAIQSEGYSETVPTKFSLSVVSWMIDKLPNFSGSAILGLDFDGELYFQFITSQSTSYLSLEQNPQRMHLLVNYKDGTRTMLDNIGFKQGVIPKQIVKELIKL